MKSMLSAAILLAIFLMACSKSDVEQPITPIDPVVTPPKQALLDSVYIESGNDVEYQNFIYNADSSLGKSYWQQSSGNLLGYYYKYQNNRMAAVWLNYKVGRSDSTEYATFTYAANGTISTAMVQGYKYSYEFDAQKQLVKKHTFGSDNSLQHTYTYTWQNSNLVKEVDSVFNGLDLKVNTYTYTYDNKINPYRMITAAAFIVDEDMPLINLSANNIVKQEEVYYGNNYTYIYNYTYNEKNYPLTCVTNNGHLDFKYRYIYKK
ncbi:hypothetical protein [Chitinophaga sp. Cy-1792]|uniref:hypothetical protein n=1 Tax=Chitinophaga sp. Cy-1792 TaxID=2608339 RepID=UPI00141DB3C6|nr:hypothetical protein [Chitinophaga sp. Cy-1792]NIG52746.1 hypothetical protein [Chitinophaga sp. Cy-1792]